MKTTNIKTSGANQSPKKFKPSSVRIFEEADGFHFCDTTIPYLDARGRGYKSKAEALRAARYQHEMFPE